MATSANLDQVFGGNPNVANQPNMGIEGAQGAAAAQQNLQTAQTKQQELQQQLDDTKFQSVVSRMQTQLNIQDPTIQKQVASMNDKAMKGTTYDGFFTNLHKSDDAQAGASAALDYLAGNPLDSAGKKSALQAIMDPIASHQLFSSFQTKQQQDAMAAVANMKAQSAQQIAQGKNDSSQQVAQIGATGRVQAAQVQSGPGSVRQESLDERVHNNALNAVNKDSNLGALQTSYQNLNNALSNFQASGRNPEEFAQLQQSLRGNAGIKGNSTGSERADSYLHDYGITAQEFMQKLSGNPQDIMKSSPDFVDLVQHVADAELDNKKKQAAGQIDRLTRGHQSFYQKPGNEGRADDFANSVNARYQQFDLPNKYNPNSNSQPQQQSAPPPQGQAPQGQAPAASAQPSPAQQAFIAQAQKLVNPATKQPYSMDDIQGMIQKKGIK